MNIIHILRERGFITESDKTESITDPKIEHVTEKRMMTCYAGFDPTAKSLHVGNLLVIMALAQFQRHSHRPIALVGGATGMIGDPSGKSEERNLITQDQVKENMAGIRFQLEKFLDFNPGDNSALIVNNADWILPYSFVEFLRDIGKHFRVGAMLAKESVSSRQQGEGLSFTEFAYMLLQAFDFMHLFEKFNCEIQIGGRDQWGNITAGCDLVRKVKGRTVYGIVFPLLETASGKKFGKTEEGTVWLDPELTSPYQFYQFWIRTDDRDVASFLKFFTFLDLEQIAAIVDSHNKNPERREAQKALATEVTRMAHGEEGLQAAQKASEVLFGKEISGLSDRNLLDIFADIPSTEMQKKCLNDSLMLVDLLTMTELCSSKSEARRFLSSGSIYISNRKVYDAKKVVTEEDLTSETTMVLRLGKKNYHVIRFQ